MTFRKTSVLVSLAAVAVLAFALSASVAQARTPAPGFGEFAGCPSPEENPNVEGCFYAIVKSGHFKMGNKDVPITNPIKISGGSDVATGKIVYNSKGGVSKAKQKVPGGVIGLTGLTWLAEFLGIEALTLYATTELAGELNNPFEDPFVLPIKVHLENSTGVLGSNCYVGSNSNPIVLHLTRGTTSPPPPNKPITGREPEISVAPGPTLVAKNALLVDNSFAAPGASGCVLTLFGFIPINLNPLVNLQSGLPAAAGTNVTEQVSDAFATEAKTVYP